MTLREVNCGEFCEWGSVSDTPHHSPCKTTTERRNMRTHAELIIKWALGAEVEFKSSITDNWVYTRHPMWDENVEFRIRTEPVTQPKGELV